MYSFFFLSGDVGTCVHACALYACVRLLCIGQLGDLDLRAPFIAFNTT